MAILVVIEGPHTMIGKELKVFTESVNLGRDPAQADFTFYSDTNSSISGLHAKLERSNGQWRLVGISKSGNETFLDDESIPNFEPHPIHSGQHFRMGYIGQQPVELEFRDVANSGSDAADETNKRKTKVAKEIVPEGTFGSTEFDFNGSKPGTDGKDEAPKAEVGEENTDSIFSSFRNRK